MSLPFFTTATESPTTLDCCMMSRMAASALSACPALCRDKTSKKKAVIINEKQEDRYMVKVLAVNNTEAI